MASRRRLEGSEETGKHHLRSVAPVPPELEVAEVLRQVLARDVNMSASDAEFQQRPEGFRAIHMMNAVHPHVDAVVDRAIPIAMPCQIGIGSQLIGADGRAGLYILKNM